MIELSPDAKRWLLRIGDATGGTWPVSPFLNSADSSALMRLGLVECVQPPSPGLPYAMLTAAGREKLREVRPTIQHQPDMGEIIRAVCGRFGLQRGELLSTTKERRIARPRQIAMYLARRLTHASFPVIASCLRLGHHSTVMHGVELVAKQVANREEMAADVLSLEAVLTRPRG